MIIISIIIIIIIITTSINTITIIIVPGVGGREPTLVSLPFRAGAEPAAQARSRADKQRTECSPKRQATHRRIHKGIVHSKPGPRFSAIVHAVCANSYMLPIYLFRVLGLQTHIYIYIYVYLSLSIYIYIYMYTYIYIYMHMCIYIYIYTCVYTHITNIYIYR